MLTTKHAFSGLSVNDVDAAREFYGTRLGLAVETNGMGILTVTLPGGATVIMYPKPDHVPATFTVLNLVVDDVDRAVDELAELGITMQKYENAPYQDERGIVRGKASGNGPDIAWFADPAGNILSVLTD
jgi:predicted enzyme related to lactoylglutathione lyase